MDYEKQAIDFLNRHKTAINIHFVGLKTNKEWGEKKDRPLYEITLKNQRHVYTFDFWDCVYNAEIKKMTAKEYSRKKGIGLTEATKELRKKKAAAIPTAYDVLMCLTTYDVGTFEDFCGNFGYDTDSRRAERIYFAVQKEYNNMKRLFTPEELEELQEIS